MKKDELIIVGGLVVAVIAIAVFKDQILGALGQEKSSEADDDFVPPVTTAGIGQTSPPQNVKVDVAPQPQQPSQQTTQQQGGQQQQVQAEPILPYALTEIDPSLRDSSAYTDLFGGCDFPIVDGSENVCVQRLQDALDVPTSGAFDDVTQFALDKYIERMPNRKTHFGGFTRDGCISFDPATNTETNLCGLNHDQYLDILFKMGIPLNETYDV